MKNLTLLITILTLTGFSFAQSVDISDADDNILIQIHDEGTTGSIYITSPFAGLPSLPANKLYASKGSLYWSGNKLGTAGADGWTDDGVVVRLVNSADKVGIGTATPLAKLHVSGDDGVLFTGTYDSGTIPVEGTGTRMMWYPKKAAFRVGYVSGTQWADTNIGGISTAMGYNTTASGVVSTAMGESTTASGGRSTAMGYHTTASNPYSTAIGSYTTASGDYSTAMGHNTTASGDASTAMGAGTTASGINSTAMGAVTTASGTNSTATGYETTASGPSSTAMGANVSTNGKSGSFIIGDLSTATLKYCGSNNEMIMRFAGGYHLYTNSATTIGAELLSGANSWASISDSTKKENYLNANGEYFLNSIAKLRLGSWNYKSQDAKDFRHYGPMAQEIFHYFGRDDYGTVGNDTTLATADMDGIMMIALQALEKRTVEQADLISVLINRIEQLEKK